MVWEQASHDSCTWCMNLYSLLLLLVAMNWPNRPSRTWLLSYFNFSPWSSCFFAILSPNWWPTGGSSGPNLAPPTKWVNPLDAPLPKRTCPIRMEFDIHDPTQINRFRPFQTPK
jgi:hypothetical protein